MQESMEALKSENERLRRDNERFVRIIDSGEWGRGRVAELVQAGQVLQQERDQLAKLMGHLRQDYEAVERAKVAQQEELAALKARMRKKGAANNKMIVKVRRKPWPPRTFLGTVQMHACGSVHGGLCCFALALVSTSSMVRTATSR